MDLELRHLRALLAVVDTGTFTGAAAALHTSQASVSRTVAALERALGARVLHRTTREVSLTPVGSRVLTHARRVVEELAAMQRSADEAGSDLRVGHAPHSGADRARPDVSHRPGRVPAPAGRPAGTEAVPERYPA